MFISLSSLANGSTGKTNPVGGRIIKVERPRAARYPFIANIELTDLESGHKTKQKTCDLSLYGCGVAPGSSLLTGARVWLQIIHNGQVFQALGRVTHVRPSRGMGIVFTSVHEREQLLLEKWVAEVRDGNSQSR